MKNWAYRQDQLVTTHPIAGQVAGHGRRRSSTSTASPTARAPRCSSSSSPRSAWTASAKACASTSRHALLGNTTLSQFLDALETGSGATSGVVAALARDAVAEHDRRRLGGRWRAHHLDGPAPDRSPPTTRRCARTRLDVGLVRDDEATSRSSRPCRSQLDGAEARSRRRAGCRRPTLVFPNHNDHAYAKVALDASRSPSRVQHTSTASRTRCSARCSGGALEHDARPAAHLVDYLAMVARKDRRRARARSSIEPSSGSRRRPSRASSRTSGGEREAHTFFASAWDTLQAAEGDLQIIWGRTLIGIAMAPGGHRAPRRARGWPRDRSAASRLDQEMRWAIATKLTPTASRTAPRSARSRARERPLGPRPARHAHGRSLPPGRRRQGRGLGEVPRRRLRLTAPHSRGHERLQPLAPEGDSPARTTTSSSTRVVGSSTVPKKRRPRTTSDASGPRTESKPKRSPGPVPSSRPTPEMTMLVRKPARSNRRDRAGDQVPGIRAGLAGQANPGDGGSTGRRGSGNLAA